MGVKPENIYIDDLREEFVRDFVFPMFRANARLRGRLPARHLDRPAADRQAPDRDRARDRRRRRLPRRDRQGQRPGALRARPPMRWSPDIKVIAPWREWAFTQPHGR